MEAGGEKAGEHGTEGKEAQGESFNAMHHILDQVVFGVDQGSGRVVWQPYGKHGHAVAGYAPRTIGPMKLEFTKHMAGVRGALTNAVEAVVVFVRDEMVAPIGGHHLGHYTPLFLTYFLFILFANLLGMIPSFGTVTGNVGVTLALGGSVYVLVWILGMWNQGPMKYILHLVPPGTPFWMWPLMFVLELMGPLIKCFVLCVRLFANMIAGHLIVGTVLGLGAFGGALTAGLAAMMLAVGLPLALGISLLEILVCFIQAYVFTLLAVIFIGAAVHPEH
ncbi:MAG: F0F1 ATP synthase subunit A [Planctomycetota bacterium]|nr:F0F1 ATP synthase subunit A [Planctomycetota bacterium]